MEQVWPTYLLRRRVACLVDAHQVSGKDDPPLQFVCARIARSCYEVDETILRPIFLPDILGLPLDSTDCRYRLDHVWSVGDR